MYFNPTATTRCRSPIHTHKLRQRLGQTAGVVGLQQHQRLLNEDRAQLHQMLEDLAADNGALAEQGHQAGGLQVLGRLQTGEEALAQHIEALESGIGQRLQLGFGVLVGAQGAQQLRGEHLGRSVAAHVVVLQTSQSVLAQHDLAGLQLGQQTLHDGDGVLGERSQADDGLTLGQRAALLVRILQSGDARLQLLAVHDDGRLNGIDHVDSALALRVERGGHHGGGGELGEQKVMVGKKV